MSTSAMDSFHLDETACGPLCQHPQCWASNRRMERGLPRVMEALKHPDSDDEVSLPTVKIMNLLDEYGDSRKDRYPTRAKGKDTMTPVHMRSASAPNIMAANNRSPVNAPFTPFTSPLGVRGGSVRSTRSAKTPTRSRSRTTPKISRVEVKEMLGDFGDLPPPRESSSSFYIWCPSKRVYERQSEGKEKIPQSTSKEPLRIQPKDLTDDMVPNRVERKRRSKNQKNKRAVHETPTGGRPYTHPTRSPPPVTRRTLPQDIDDGITQLLSLPREVLMEVLDHIKKSDLLDKGKVQMLISRILPHIHLQQDSPLTSRESITTPLLDSGILQNHKVTLHNMQQKPYDKHEFPQTDPGNIPFFLDDTVISKMGASVYDGMPEEERENFPMEEMVEVPMTQSTGRMAKMKPLAPIKPHPRDAEPVYRLSSVSAKSLPPLKPGVRPVKPFDYTNTGLSLDLTLVPLPPPKIATPELRAPQTPYSAIASTLHVTVPSVPSPDRTVSSTPVMQYGKSPVPQLGKSCTRSSPSPLPSEEFPELHWYDADILEHPLHALSPSMSTRVPKAPQGTPATALRYHLFTRESNPSKVLSEHREDSVGTSSSPTPHPPGRTMTETTEPGLGTIQETHTVNSTYRAGDSVTGYNSRSDFVMSPNKQLDSSMSPYGFSASIAAAQNSDKDAVPVVPVTPAPTSATEESWPIIDERDFMQTPVKDSVPLLANQQTELPAPVAPPPSPEPRDPNPDFDYQLPEVNKSTGSSLAPLAEEEEEWDQSEKDEACDDQPAQKLPTEGNTESNQVDKVEGSVEVKIEGSIEAKVEGSIEAKAEGSVEAKKEGSIEAKVEGSIEAKVEGSVEAKVEGSVEAKVEGSVEAKVELSVETKAEGSFEAKVEGPLEAKVEGHLEAKVEGPLEAKVEGSLEANVEGSVEANAMQNKSLCDNNASAEVSTNDKKTERQDTEKSEQITETCTGPKQEEPTTTGSKADDQHPSELVKEETIVTSQVSEQKIDTTQHDDIPKNATQSDDVMGCDIANVTPQNDDITNQESTKLISKSDVSKDISSQSDVVTNTAHENVNIPHEDVTNSDNTHARTATDRDSVPKTELLKEETVSEIRKCSSEEVLIK